MTAPDWIAAYTALGFTPHLIREGHMILRMAKVFGEVVITAAPSGNTIAVSADLGLGVIQHHSLASDPTRAWHLMREDIARRAKEMSALAEAMRPPVTRSTPPPQT